MSAETDWGGLAWRLCSPAAKARASRPVDDGTCKLCGATEGMCEIGCGEIEVEPSRCPRCLHYLTDEARCAECGQHAHE